jgi:NAD(P) transhydrogenase subunit alpha
MKNMPPQAPTIVSRDEVLRSADIILSINEPSQNDIDHLKSKIILGIYQPLFNHALIKECADKGVTVFSIDMIPRTTRAQSMDVLSSQANIAGYKAVLAAANLFPKYFPMFMTAAGSIPPAKMLILGCGSGRFTGHCHQQKTWSSSGGI